MNLNNIVSNNLLFLPWPKAAAKEGALGQMSKNFQVNFIHINCFENPNKKIYNRAEKLYYDATIFVF